METTMTAQQPAWFRHWFDSPFYHQLYGNRNDKEAAGFIDALLTELRPRHHSRMMDLGCGAGRHAKYLASKGFDVTGTDLASSSIRSARKSETSRLRFYQQDMRIPFGAGEYDFVFNFFTSFGYFKTAEDNHRVMSNISRALKPGGTIVIDYLNVDYSEEHLVSEEEKEIDGICYRLTRWSDETHFFKEILIDDGKSGQPIRFCEQVARLRLQDFVNLFDRNGLCLQNAYGDYRLNSYNAKSSPRLILIAKKSGRDYTRLHGDPSLAKGGC